MEEAASAQRQEMENNPRQNDTNLISTDIHLDKVPFLAQNPKNKK
jgi:hypothetical protein